MRISDWSSDVCSSDLRPAEGSGTIERRHHRDCEDGIEADGEREQQGDRHGRAQPRQCADDDADHHRDEDEEKASRGEDQGHARLDCVEVQLILLTEQVAGRSEEHTSELQSLMRISYAVICLKKKKK